MTQPKMKIKKGDTVVVRAGSDKGKVAEVLKVYPADSLVLIKDVNVVKRHIRPSATHSGGIEHREKPIHVSNVAFSLDGKPTRIGYVLSKDGLKQRIAKKTGKNI